MVSLSGQVLTFLANFYKPFPNEESECSDAKFTFNFITKPFHCISLLVVMAPICIIQADTGCKYHNDKNGIKFYSTNQFVTFGWKLAKY